MLDAARRELNPGQGEFTFDDDGRVGGPVVTGQASRLLWDTLRAGYRACGFDRVGDEAFAQLVLARLIEPASKTATIRILTDLGLPAPHLSTVKRCLARIQERDYRSRVAEACFEHAATTGGLSLVLYDVTTLYFQAEHEDELRRVGYSKERRVDPQVVVGLLVDRSGFPLEIGCFAGDHAETHTIVPILDQFRARHDLDDLVVVADAGMLSNDNLLALQDAGYRFIVGARTAKAPLDLMDRFQADGTAFDDGEIVETTTRLGKPRTRWRAVYQYSKKRFVRDMRTLNEQRTRAIAQIAGEKPMKKARFVKTSHGDAHLNETAIERAALVAGLKGYVTNLSSVRMTGSEVIGAYHELWHVEQSFRMSKSDLRARPMFHHTRDSIEAHLTIVFTALAVARHLQATTGVTIKELVRRLRPLQEVTIHMRGHDITAQPKIPAEIRAILDNTETH